MSSRRKTKASHGDRLTRRQVRASNSVFWERCHKEDIVAESEGTGRRGPGRYLGLEHPRLKEQPGLKPKGCLQGCVRSSRPVWLKNREPGGR